MYVADASDGKVYTYNMPDAIDARLATLSLSGLDMSASSTEDAPSTLAYLGEGRDRHDGRGHNRAAPHRYRLRPTRCRRRRRERPPGSNRWAVSTEITVTVTSA